MDRNSPIGVFDSGIGGLTVLREITRLLPNENTIYLGDTARVPYGSKSKETVERYSFEVANFLIKHDIKLLVAACNTASAYAVPKLKRELKIPVLGVIEPGAKAAVSVTSHNKIGVIGTEGTIRSSAYCTAIKSVNPEVSTFTKACPLFVPLVEEGWANDEVTALVAERYLCDLKDSGIDTLVLGCTHYPLLKETIASVMGSAVTLIDSAASTAAEVKRILSESNMFNAKTGQAKHRFFVTDSPERFLTVGRRFFGDNLSEAELAQLTEN
ncbi:MAG: glutamate racemase [Deltaproteobacteria bacterium]|nr:glutamate racemase [Deltaproteobacteria bacterium]